MAQQCIFQKVWKIALSPQNSKDIFLEMFLKHHQNISTKFFHKTSEKYPQKYPPKYPRNIPRNIPEYPQKCSQIYSQKNPRNITRNNPQNIPSNNPRNILRNILRNSGQRSNCRNINRNISMKMSRNILLQKSFQLIVRMQGFRHLCVHFRKTDNQYGTYGIVDKLDLSKFH